MSERQYYLFRVLVGLRVVATLGYNCISVSRLITLPETQTTLINVKVTLCH